MLFLVPRDVSEMSAQGKCFTKNMWGSVPKLWRIAQHSSKVRGCVMQSKAKQQMFKSCSWHAHGCFLKAKIRIFILVWGFLGLNYTWKFCFQVSKVRLKLACRQVNKYKLNLNRVFNCLHFLKFCICLLRKKVQQLKRYKRLLQCRRDVRIPCVSHPSTLKRAHSKGHKPLPEMGDFLLAVCNASSEFVTASSH